MNYEEKHVARVCRWFVIAYWAHLPVFVAIAAYRGTSLVTALLLGVLGAIGPALLHWFYPGKLLTAVAVGIGGQVLSAGLIHLGGGMIEMHFHVFVLLPLLSVFGRMPVVIAAAATIAVHHLTFFFFLPASVFNYHATLWSVVLHAVFVILAAVPGCVLARVFGNYVVGAGQLMRDLSGAGAALIDSSDKLSSASRDAAAAADAQASSVEKIGGTLRDFAAQARQSSESLATVQGDHVQKMRSALGQIEQSSAQMTSAMTGIDESSKSITRIVKTIEEIAFQTNILALNAAVEAARAGEAGAGFAVVADEVRTLARRAAQAAQETSALITVASQRGVEGARVNRDVSAQLAVVQGSFRELDALIGNVARTVSEQREGVEQIDESIQSLGATAQARSVRSKAVAATSQLLREQADLVSSSIHKLAFLTHLDLAPTDSASVPSVAAVKAKFGLAV